MIFLRNFVLAVVCCFGLVSAVEAQTSRPKSAPQQWSVVKVGSIYQVIKSNELSTLKKRVAKADKKQLDDWNKAKKAARKDSREFKTPKPKKTKIKVISKRLKSKRAANERRVELENADRKKRERSERSRSQPRSRPRGE